MNRREKLHAARAGVARTARDLCEELMILDAGLAMAVIRLAVQAFAAGYEAAEPDACARCGAEMDAAQIAAADEESGT